MKSTQSTAFGALLFGALALTACDDAGMGRAEVEFIAPEAPEVQTSRLYPGPCLTERDYDIDGTINSETHYIYDTGGRPSVRVFDEGELVSTSDAEYDANGNIVKIVLTGYLAHTSYWTYNDQNQLIEIARDIDNNGTIEWVTTYHYDGEGLLTHLVLTQSDDTIHTTTFTRDADGHTVVEHSKREHNDGSSTDCRDVFTDRELRLAEELVDDDCDGMPESTKSVTHNQDWSPVLREEDFDADGIIDYRAIFQYDARNNLAYQLHEHAALDPNDPSQFTSITATFTAAGKPLEIRTDSGDDGTVDHLDTYTYDRFGNALTRLERGLTRQSFGRDVWTVHSYDCFDAQEDTP